MKKYSFNVTIDICVEVDDDVSIEDAEAIALFNVPPITQSISCALDSKLSDIEVGSYQVNSSSCDS